MYIGPGSTKVNVRFINKQPDLLTIVSWRDETLWTLCLLEFNLCFEQLNSLLNSNTLTFEGVLLRIIITLFRKVQYFDTLYVVLMERLFIYFYSFSLRKIITDYSPSRS